MPTHPAEPALAANAAHAALAAHGAHAAHAGNSAEPRSRSLGERGFSFIEALLATLITAEVILAALALFDFHNKLARVQAQVSDMQQSLRVAQFELVRFTREAGRGGFPAMVHWATPNQATGAIAVRNNVGGAVSDQIAIGFSGSPKAVDGSDVLTVRGVFSTPVFQLNPLRGGAVALLPAGSTTTNATAGTVVVCATTPTGIPQDLAPLIGAINAAAKAGQAEPLILVSPLDETIYAVVELDTANSVLGANQAGCPSPQNVAFPNGILIAFKVTGGTNAGSFQQLGAVNSPQGLPARLTNVAWLGILEEYRYYVRQDFAVPGDANSDPAPHLSRARMYPGTELPYFGDAANLQVDVADNVLDLQVALGYDVNGDGLVSDGTVPGLPNEWFHNTPGDWPPGWWGNTLPPPLREVRISTLSKTGNPDFQYQGPTLASIEDRVYTAADFANTFHGRAYRHRLLTTVVGLRNL